MNNNQYKYCDIVLDSSKYKKKMYEIYIAVNVHLIIVDGNGSGEDKGVGFGFGYISVVQMNRTTLRGFYRAGNSNAVILHYRNINNFSNYMASIRNDILVPIEAAIQNAHG